MGLRAMGNNEIDSCISPRGNFLAMSSGVISRRAVNVTDVAVTLQFRSICIK
jgi:hypothetical protein